MSAEPRPVCDLLPALVGPIVWAAHFFAVYLAEAVLCTAPAASDAAVVRFVCAGLTLLALAILLWAHWRSGSDHIEGLPRSFSMTRPLIGISIVAVLWTSIPLFMLQGCTPAGA
jgi:hypothetical protein